MIATTPTPLSVIICVMTSTLESLARSWLDAKEAAKPSPNTTFARENDLAMFGRVLAGLPDPTKDDRASLADLASLTVDDIGHQALAGPWAAFVRPRSRATVQRAHSNWRQFGLWLVRTGHIAANPMDHIERPPNKPLADRHVEQAVLADVAAQPGQVAAGARQPWPERDEALFAVLIMGGLRISEAKDLQVGQTHLTDDPPTLLVTGKGDKSRAVPIPPEAVAKIQTYMASRKARNFGTGPGTPLLLRPNGEQMTRGSIDYAVRSWFRRAGRTPPKGAVTHSMRHTYATMLLGNGASLPEIQRLLGHADLATTQRYLGVADSQLADAAMANPARQLLAMKSGD